ncbi:MAG: OmpA family protein [Blastocatellia bacterium]|nr:OmpA family protein [Blastocatellia bacterium]
MTRWPLIIWALWIPLHAGTFAQERSDFVFRATAATFPPDRKVELRLRGTTRYSRTSGTATVHYKDGIARLTITVKDLDPPTHRQYTTYVFWAVTPEGLVENIGEFRPRKTSILRIFARSWGGTIETATRHRTFCLVMTAEPHFLVEAPSREVVLASLPPDEKEGLETEPVEVHFRGDIGMESVPWREERVSTERDREMPVELLEARRALDLIRFFRVSEHADQEARRAEALLEEAERAFERGFDERAAILARRAIVMSEIARRLARERREAAEQRQREMALADLDDQVKELRENLNRITIERDELRRQLEERERDLRDMHAQLEGVRAALAQAERRAAQSAESERRYREEIERLSRQLIEEQTRARTLAEELRVLRLSSISINEHRAKLALARVAETRDEDDRFILVLPNEELFVPTRTPGTPQLRRDVLPKLDYIATILATFSLGTYVIEGHVSGPGSPERLKALSEANAAAVAAYLMSKGVPSELLKPIGRGAEAPLEKGTAPRAHRRNQRVEIIISSPSSTSSPSRPTSSAGVR